MNIFRILSLLVLPFSLSAYKLPGRMTKMSLNENTVRQIVQKNYFINKYDYNTLLDKIDTGEIEGVYFLPKLDTVIAEQKEKSGELYKDYSITRITPFVADNIVTETTKKHVETVFLQEPSQDLNQFQKYAGDLFGFANNLFIGLFIFSLIANGIRFFQQQQMPNNGGLNNIFTTKNINKDIPTIQKANISLSSFAGSPEIFQECTEVVSYLKNSTVYKNAGAEIPRGILLEGPPGTGKTLLAKAIASEAGANFISITASEFVEVFVGVGASKIRKLFENARNNKPCIIFIDEIDAVGRQRGAGINMANDEREQTLNQLLAEMDGFGDNEGILVIAATNRKDVLDSALLRPGRFDRLITVPLPDRDSRRQILRVHSKNKVFSEDVNLDLVAELTSGFSGAQLKNLLNEAAIYAARNGNTVIDETNIMNALDKLIIGLIKNNDTRDDVSKRRVAIHEVGHAFLAYTFNDYFDLKKVSIESTYNGAGGYTVFNEYQNITDSGLYTKDLLYKRLVITMGGKAAERIFYGEEYVSLGANQDLKQANSLARRMIGNFGMGTRLETFYNENIDNDANPFLGRTFGSSDKYSESTKEIFDKEALLLIDSAYMEAKQILHQNIDMLHIVIDFLLNDKYLSGQEFRNIIEAKEIFD
uniref:AAA+ ATPase domain-containing protein n=1 Tax=viral metagenome TaxID=1070528 RepID=A0A6C0DEF9_9ZZZZ